MEISGQETSLRDRPDGVQGKQAAASMLQKSLGPVSSSTFLLGVLQVVW